ncbi:MAG: DUF5107 domain-containing protein [Agriterribacter sp.]
MRCLNLIIAITFSASVLGQSNATFSEYKKTFITYPFADPNPIALSNNVYPYFRFDGFTDRPVDKEWKVVELQNDYISLIILPEVGGKIWAATVKKTGKPFIYYNHVVKFRDIGMRGPWTSGGLEANYGIIGHTPNCSTPVDYIARQNEDGSVSCIIGVLDLLTRSNWRIEINLPNDKAYFTTQSSWYNNSSFTQPYYHWMNLGMPAKGNLEFVFPGTHYIGHGGEYSDWPVNKSNGKKINFYEENDFGGPKSYHVFGKLTNFFGAYYHQTNDGMVRYGNYDDKAGKKIWIWGLSRQGMIWERMLTDTDGQYVEIQSGRLFNQNASQSSFTPFKHIGFEPYASDNWKEYWYPIQNTNGIAEANPYGAFNMKYENGWIRLYFSAVQTINDSLVVKHNGTNIYSRKISLSPLQTFSDSIKADVNADALIATLGKNKLVYNSDPQHNVISRPLVSNDAFDWNTAYGLYVLGKELFDQKLYAEAEEKLKASLEKDALFTPSLLQLSILQYRNLQYEPALQNIKHCLAFDTHNGESNYYYGLINLALGNETDALEGFSIAALSSAFKSPAFTELAKLYCKKAMYKEAIAYADKAVLQNATNVNAYLVKAVANRKYRNTAEAETTLQTVLKVDPINHFVRYEQYLLHPDSSSDKNFYSLIRNELPGETYTEMAIWYYNTGGTEEAKDLFKRMEPNPESTAWLAFLDNQPANLTNVSAILAFPFRAETAKVFEHLLQKQTDWMLKYQLALIYRDRNRVTECKELLMSCKNDPPFAPFYVVRAQVMQDDTTQALADLIKAARTDAAEWRYQKLLAEYYMGHDQPQKALAIATAFHKQHPDNLIMGMLYAKTLLLNKQYAETDKLLTHLQIIPFEGATEGKMLYREAKLMQAVAALQQKKFSVAKKFIEQGKLWPENLGVGKPYDDNIDTRLEDWMLYLTEKNKTGNNAKALLDKIISFKPATENTISNFLPSNALITALAISKANGKDQAMQWLEQQATAFPAHKEVFEWSRNVLNGGNKSSITENIKDSNQNILTAMLRSGVLL